MLPLLELFGVKAGNGQSTFAVDIDTPSELLALVNQFFKAPKRDTRGNSSVNEEDADLDTRR